MMVEKDHILVPLPVPRESIKGIIAGEDSPGHKIYHEANGKVCDIRNAVDIFCDEGTPVFVIEDGVVVKTKKDVKKNYPNIFNPKNVPVDEEDGNYVAVKHKNGFISFYAHLKLNSVCVEKGDFLKKGQKIGEVGNTGLAGVHPEFGKFHLHFYVGKQFNNVFKAFPLKFIDLE